MHRRPLEQQIRELERKIAVLRTKQDSLKKKMAHAFQLEVTRQVLASDQAGDTAAEAIIACALENLQKNEKVAEGMTIKEIRHHFAQDSRMKSSMHVRAEKAKE